MTFLFITDAFVQPGHTLEGETPFIQISKYYRKMNILLFTIPNKI